MNFCREISDEQIENLNLVERLVLRKKNLKEIIRYEKELHAIDYSIVHVYDRMQ